MYRFSAETSYHANAPRLVEDRADLSWHLKRDPVRLFVLDGAEIHAMDLERPRRPSER